MSRSSSGNLLEPSCDSYISLVALRHTSHIEALLHLTCGTVERKPLSRKKNFRFVGGVMLCKLSWRHGNCIYLLIDPWGYEPRCRPHRLNARWCRAILFILHLSVFVLFPVSSVLRSHTMERNVTCVLNWTELWHWSLTSTMWIQLDYISRFRESFCFFLFFIFLKSPAGFIFRTDIIKTSTRSKYTIPLIKQHSTAAFKNTSRHTSITHQTINQSPSVVFISIS